MKDLEQHAGADWNGFVQLPAMTDYDDLQPSQRPAHLVFWYEAEVQNGGHLQYFINRGDQRGEETVQSLYALGARAQARLLEKALATWRSSVRQEPADASEYAAMVREGEFNEQDHAFHACPDSLNSLLIQHLVDHEDEFVAGIARMRSRRDWQGF
jgi:hypothetical protein